VHKILKRRSESNNNNNKDLHSNKILRCSYLLYWNWNWLILTYFPWFANSLAQQINRNSIEVDVLYPHTMNSRSVFSFLEFPPMSHLFI